MKGTDSSHVQTVGGTIDQYVNELRNRSKTCEVGGLTESLIKDRIVCGITDNNLRERLLRVSDLDLETALAAETVKSQAKELLNEASCNVDAVEKDALVFKRSKKRVSSLLTSPPAKAVSF